MKKIQSWFAKFLKIMEEVFVFLDLVNLCGQVSGGFVFMVCGVPCPSATGCKGSQRFCELSNRTFSCSSSLPLCLVFIHMKM